MNDMNKTILEFLLTEEEYWDKKTRKLKYDSIITAFINLRDGVFYEEVYFPYMFRFWKHLKGMFSLPDDLFESYETDDGKKGIWCTDDDLIDEVQVRLEYGHVVWWKGGAIGKKIMADEWQFAPTVEEILALNIKPSLVPGKVDKAGNVQVSLF